MNRKKEKERMRKKRIKQSSAYAMNYLARRRSGLRMIKCTMIPLLVLTIILGSVLGIYKHEVNAISANLTRPEHKIYRTDKKHSDGVRNILVVGTDKRSKKYASRSDLIMVVTIAPQTDEISITSFERDLYVKIPGYGRNKLNAAYAYGQEKLLMKTLDKAFGIKIDDYVTIDMYSIYRFIDACGGTRVKVKKNQIEYINMYIKNLNHFLDKKNRADTLKKSDTGEVLLNGVQAISYARVRYDGDDFSRTRKQRMAVLGILKNWQYMLKHGQLLKLLKCYKAIPESCSCITTSMDEETARDFFSLTNVIKYLSYDIRQSCIPLKGSWKYDRSPSNASIVVFKKMDPDGVNGLKKNKAYLKKHGVYGY